MNSDLNTANWPDPAPAGARRSVLAEDLHLDGLITSTGPVDVSGKVVGSISAPEVLIAQSGSLEGEALALKLTVLGTVTGTMSARSVTLAEGAKAEGDITYQQISIELNAE
ncbi:MAG: polymer-forming cytoskeletal protein, partial [bacterium]